VVDDAERLAEIIVDNLLPRLRFSASDGLRGAFQLRLAPSPERLYDVVHGRALLRLAGENRASLWGEMASSTALTPWGTARISPPRSRYDRVCDSSRRRISCFDGGFFTAPAPCHSV
jgi:hypothetical protein